ncbi:hypothetical protein [Chroococcus sp. FPU101]|uniref:hypothetical protein n=1 Tax=Chroococcus sp. FPU101 TaxID=1974212 RepID=UPI001A909C99|nr:hypothetical protein [Chroococcus sp. FPU101]GFE69100.1 hypothetical protein CFPU101_17100 [Chroococcus sp. FPU101]
MTDPKKDPITINQIIGKEASLGGLFPTHLILPALIFLGVSYTLTIGIFSLPLPWMGAVFIWFITSWWFLVGKHPHRFINRFWNPPGTEWVVGHLINIPLIRENRSPELRKIIKDSITKPKLPPIRCKTNTGKQFNGMPYENFQDLVGCIEIQKNNEIATGFLLNKGEKYQIIFAFELKGIRRYLSNSEITNTLKQISEGLKEILPSETITFCSICQTPSNDEPRQKYLEQALETCQIPLLKIILKKEEVHRQKLNELGKRQNWEKLVFCTYTIDKNGNHRSNDFISKTLRGFIYSTNKLLHWFSGTQHVYDERFYKQLLVRGFENGFLRYNILLNTRIGLSSKPVSINKLKKWLWNLYNDSETNVPLDEIKTIRLKELATDYIIEENYPSKDINHVLIKGTKGRSSCPEHRSSGNAIWLPGRGEKGAILTLEKRPEGYPSQQEALRNLQTIQSLPFIRDTWLISQISAASQYGIMDNLVRQAKQAKSAQKRALEKGQGRDAGAEVNAEESFEAQKLIYKGGKMLHIALAAMIWRKDDDNLNLACSQLSNSFGSAEIVREPHIAFEHFLEALPTTMKRLLESSSLLSERRACLPTYDAIGLLPLTHCSPINQKGVEVIDQSKQPLWIDLIHDQINRAIIVGTTGSGKSVFGWSFIINTLWYDYKVVGIDTSPGKSSTFKTAIQLLGDQGAYHQDSLTQRNLVELPDLSHFTEEERKDRLDQWKDFIHKAICTIACYELSDNLLSQRIDTILQQTLDRFLNDREIRNRYNTALHYGWQSEQWKNMPTLEDLLRFCTKEHLDIRNADSTDELAFRQIHSQFNALKTKPIWQSIGKVSNYNPNPRIQFFSLGNIANEQIQYLTALSTFGTCLNMALSSRRCLFVGDEISTIFRKFNGFSDRIGELCAIGRKNGIAVLLLTQDIKSILDCSAASQILGNMTYKIIGKITDAEKNQWINNPQLNFDPDVIEICVQDNFAANATEGCSQWLIERSGQYWFGKYYPNDYTLSTVANEEKELKYREEVLSKYPPTLKGQLQGLKIFTKDYVQCLKQGKDLPTTFSTTLDIQKAA